MKSLFILFTLTSLSLFGAANIKATAIAYSASGQANTLQLGDCNTVSVTVRNSGSSSGSASVTLYIAMPSGQYQKSQNVSVGAGRTQTVTFTGISLKQSGNYGLKAWCGTDIKSAVHRNAFASKKCAQGGDQPDLAPQPPRFATPAKIGYCSAPYISLRNNGTVAANGNIRALVSVQQGSTTIWQQVVLFGSIAAGAKSEVQVEGMHFPSAGSYTVRIEADDINAVAESNEGNNVRTSSVSVSQDCGAQGTNIPDLIPMTMIFNDGGAKAGYCSSANLAIKNIGGGTVQGTVRMMFKVKQNGQTIHQQTVLFPGPIPANGFSNATAVNIHFPSTGTFQIERFVDDLNQVNEGA
ncbi:MAG: hypothetical protein KDC71_11615, partial [Acidobacteria bacterium]|nr:hypothetical protein [Acidobacteriota bacterium]